MRVLECFIIRVLVFSKTVDFRGGLRFPAGERRGRKDIVQSFPAASLAALSPGSRLSRYSRGSLRPPLQSTTFFIERKLFGAVLNINKVSGGYVDSTYF